MGILKDRLLITITTLGLLLRLILIFLPGFQIDVTAWFGWAERLNQVGFAHFYSDQIWTNYTPGYLYILYLAGSIKNLLNITNGQFYLLLKIPSILAEILISIFIYKLISKESKMWARLATAAVLFNPAFIFNSAVWGQIDGLLSLLFLLSIYFLNQKKLILAGIYFGLAFLIKPQAITLIPVYSLYLISNFSIQSFLKLSVPALITIFLASVPFFPKQFWGFPQLFLRMSSDYSYTSLFAYNFWGIVGFWIPDNHLWINLSYQTWGYILFVGYWIVVAYFFFKKKLSLYSLAVLASLSFFFLPTRVHERYLYPSLVFLILTASLLRSPLLFMLTIILSLIHFFNLYYVYVYYNEFYLKLPKMLYNPILYDFLSTNGKLLSVTSTALFILISIFIIKSQYAHKKS